jgi:hypothetical protein
MIVKYKPGARVMTPNGPGTVEGADHAGRPKVRLDINARVEAYAPSRLTRTAADIRASSVGPNRT